MPRWLAALLERSRAARLPGRPRNLLRLAGPVVVFAVGFGIVATLGMVQITSTPTFCGSTCHNMKPYYD